MRLTFNPYELEPVQFAKLSAGLIAFFFVLILVTGILSGLGRSGFARFLCYSSSVFFGASTIFIMYGMLVSFEVARSKFDKYNRV